MNLNMFYHLLHTWVVVFKRKKIKSQIDWGGLKILFLSCITQLDWKIETY